jgi:pimeloyl-ACP methyl ester carboxylesterase
LEEAGTVLIKTVDNPPIGSTPDALNRLYARYKSYAPVAEARLKDVAPYVNTPFVARDMLAITTASGFSKLKYWGFSYGATLGDHFVYDMISQCLLLSGATFATMFPDKIDRLIIDGVQYAPDYYQGAWGASPRYVATPYKLCMSPDIDIVIK